MLWHCASDSGYGATNSTEKYWTPADNHWNATALTGIVIIASVISAVSYILCNEHAGYGRKSSSWVKTKRCWYKQAWRTAGAMPHTDEWFRNSCTSKNLVIKILIMIIILL